jgi:hypothetical protein
VVQAGTQHSLTSLACRYALDEPSFQRMCEGKEVEVKEIRHRLPCALVSGRRMQIFATAKKAAAAHAANGLDVLKCVNLPMDTYLNRPRLASLQDKWNFSNYKSMETPNKSYNTRKNPQPKQLKKRLLLFAETQIGKTGAFTHFLLECVQETRHIVLIRVEFRQSDAHLHVLYVSGNRRCRAAATQCDLA